MSVLFVWMNLSCGVESPHDAHVWEKHTFVFSRKGGAIHNVPTAALAALPSSSVQQL